VTPATTREAAARFRAFMEALGLDLSDPNLAGTDLRVARAYRELFAGLGEGAEPVLRTFPNTERYARMVSLLDIPFYSLCAHHFLPFFGTAHVAYLPGERIVGLSKLARVVEFFARRPQVQERLTEQVAGFVDERLHPAGTMVVVRARHLCMEMRGVGKPGAATTTSAIRGAFAEEALRREFLGLLPPGTGDPEQLWSRPDELRVPAALGLHVARR
jgi:GTP cyclohydrolase I